MQALSRVSSRTSESSVDSLASSSVVSTTSSNGVYVPLHKRSGSSSSQTTASSWTSVKSSKNTKGEYSNPTGTYTIHELLNLSCSPLAKVVSEERRAELKANASEILVKRFDTDKNRKVRKYQEFTTRKHLGELIKEARQEQKEKKGGPRQQQQNQKRQNQRPANAQSQTQPQSQVLSHPQSQSSSRSSYQPQAQSATASLGFSQRNGPQPSEYRPYFQTVKPHYHLDATLSHSTSLQSIVAH
ncbi:hypothetical protein BDN72DRAFT_834830 [Pluteus cervinus]|uniref:Uncharacterized protein n=1 Tax=Pluteus cervinus TaxID=181527 RepID=A0ACD3B521_9AGAR|nr:hypothetical protein BDN72DRAFT_834830 [Pluteus cervinus]